MCKILIIPKIENTKNVKRFMRAIAAPLSRNDKDGLGYVALDSSGELFSEHWLDPKQAFKNPSKNTHSAFEEIGFVLNDFISGPQSKRKGRESNEWVSLMMHTRMATCDKGLANVHPFLSKKTALIHNGIISRHPSAWEQKQSTCDSEVLLNGYDLNEVADDITRFQSIRDEAEGYFALGILSKQKNDAWILDVVKDSQAKLAAIFVHELNTIVFCTSESIVREACKSLKWKCSEGRELKDNVVLRYDAMRGTVLDHFEFKEAVKLAVSESYESSLLSWEEECRLLDEGMKDELDYEDYSDLPLNRFRKRGWLR